MRILPACLMLILMATPVMAHDDVRPHRRPKVTAAPPPIPVAVPSLVPTPAPLAMQPMSTPAQIFTASGLSAGGLASAGLRSPLPSGADLAARCRAQCAAERLSCSDDDVLPQCAPRWSACVAACSR